MARTQRLPVRHHRSWNHHDAGAGNLCAPTQVDVFANQRDVIRKTAERLKEVTTDQDRSTGSHKDVALGVVLAGVDLAIVETFHHSTETVKHLTNVQ